MFIISTFLFITSFLLIGLNNSKEFSNIGFIMIGVLLVFYFCFFLLNIVKRKYILKKEKWIFLLSFLYVMVYFSGIFVDINMASITNVIQVLMVVLFFLGVTYIPLNKINERIVFVIISGFLFFHLFWWITQGFPSSFKGAVANPNSFGGYIVFLLGIMFIFYKAKSKKSIFIVTIPTLIGICLLFLSGSRSVLLVALTFLITYYLWPIFAKKRLIFNAYFIVLTGIIFIFTYIYPKLSTLSIGKDLNNYSFKYTGKTFFSGRQYIWGDLINVIDEKLLWGYGSAASPSSLVASGLSAHNFYLQTALQVGFLGISVLFLLFLSVWNYLYLAKLHSKVRIIGSLFLGVLVYLVFEVSLTQNNLAIALLQWLIIGLGVNYTRKSLLSKAEIKV